MSGSRPGGRDGGRWPMRGSEGVGRPGRGAGQPPRVHFPASARPTACSSKSASDSTMYRIPAPRPEENRILNPATPALAFPGELDNSVNCEPARCAMTVLRSRNRLHRKTTDRSSTRHRASRARGDPECEAERQRENRHQLPPTGQEQHQQGETRRVFERQREITAVDPRREDQQRLGPATVVPATPAGSTIPRGRCAPTGKSMR